MLSTIPGCLSRRFLSSGKPRTAAVVGARPSVTLPFTLALANKGWQKALADDAHLRNGLNVIDGKVVCEPVAQAHGLPYVKAETALGM